MKGRKGEILMRRGDEEGRDASGEGKGMEKCKGGWGGEEGREMRRGEVTWKGN